LLYLQPTKPYSFALSLKRLQDFPRQIVVRFEPGSVYVRAIDQGARQGLVRIACDGDQLSVAIEGDLDPETTLAQVRSSFALDLDHEAFLTHMDEQDPVLARIARTYHGARPIESFSHWEALAWTIIAQQVNMTFAFTMKEALVRLCGRSYGGIVAFPGPEAVAKLQYEDLQAEKFTRKKAEYLIDIARSIVAGELDLASMVALPFDEAVKALDSLRGVGRWTAECVLMAAGHLDAFPADDIGIRNAVQRYYGLGHQPSAAEVRAIGQVWAPYSALACFYLWLGLLDKG
jgi:DNA-3-methyladenine glycosylase II